MTLLYKLLIVLAITVAVTTANAIEPQSCPANQEFVSGGTGCPLICCEPPPVLCPAIAFIGCQCQPGFLLNADNNCVSPLDCNCSCPPNQEFTSGSACPPQCDQTSSPICTSQAIIGCRCKPGYLLNSRNECVLPEQCDTN